MNDYLATSMLQGILLSHGIDVDREQAAKYVKAITDGWMGDEPLYRETDHLLSGMDIMEWRRLSKLMLLRVNGADDE